MKRFSKNLRYLSALVLFIFMIGTLQALSLLPSFAVSPWDDEAYLMEDADRIALYIDESNLFETKEAKLATMSKRTSVGNYELYVDTTTGEVAVRNTKTGQILATNPYDVASVPTAATKQKLMNQISLTYSNISDNKENTLGSFADSAVREQITVKNIKSGIRVEYTLGKESSKQLVPGWVEYNRYIELIRDPVWKNCFTEADLDPDSNDTVEERRKIHYNRVFGSNYKVIDPYEQVDNSYIDFADRDVKPTNSQVAEWERKYKCVTQTGPSDYNGDGAADKMVIVAINDSLTEYQRNLIESDVKQFTSYTYEDLQTDTSMTGYVATDTNPALFRLALEYTLSEDGLEVRLPANSIRFDEDTYRLVSVDVLPYFGTTSNDYTGYTFIPDGSGTLVRNEEIMSDGKNQYTIRGQIYGPDFAYHDITTYYNGKSQLMHLPVFGAIEDTVMKTYNLDKQTGYVWLQENVLDATGNITYFTSTDRIMLDAVNSKGELITTVEDYLAQFKYYNDYQSVIDGTATYTDALIIREGDPLWESPVYSAMDTLDRYNIFVAQNAAPYIDVITHFLMAPAVNEEGEPITYKGDTVYVYVNENGEVVDEANRVEGVLKIKEQLWYNGQPAYYDTNVPVDPNAVIPDEGTDDGTTEDGSTEDGSTEDGSTEDGSTEDGSTEDGSTEDGSTEDGSTEDGSTEGGSTEGGDEEEETVEIEYYNKVPAYKERYDEIAYEEIESIVSQGYLAIITEGDALCNITSAHGGVDPVVNGGGEHKYNSVYISVFPRPQDSYRLADAISVSNDSTEWVVVSDRKYTGSYRIKYVMLTDATYVDEAGAIEEYEYEASYVGMADAYRDYLLENGVLTELGNVDDDIPLYLEAFGMTTATKVVATIPVQADIALTSFEDLKTIYRELSDVGIDNINFRLTGFSKGGLYSYAPSALKFESVVGGNGDYEDIVKYAKEISAEEGKNLGIFPDFDFANVERVGGLDGFDSLKDSARTIDDRYASKRQYDATYQAFSAVGSITVSPSVFMRIFEKFAKKIDKLGVSGISVGSLGSDLNSDFDSDDAYNREDSKYYTVQLLKAIAEKYGNVMINGGNAYTLEYADHILNMPLDSTRYARANTAIPFMGMVLHGYVNYAGTATGMASDIDRELLKIIENGAAPYFTIAYDNTETLKDDINYSDYYSIDYSICKDTIIEKYTILNEALADIQTATMTDHQFLTGIRSLGERESLELAQLQQIGSTEEGYLEARAAAYKSYTNRKALAERHGEEFTEEFFETCPYFAIDDGDNDLDTVTLREYSEESVALYLKQIETEYKEATDRELAGSQIVMVEYTRKDGTTKTFILNYSAYEVTVTLDGAEYVIPSNQFAVAGI